MPLIINSLRGGHTHTHTYSHRTEHRTQKQFLKGQRVPDLKISNNY